VDPIRRQTGMTRREIIDRLIQSFQSFTGATMGTISADEYAEAEALVASKFATDAWLHRVP